MAESSATTQARFLQLLRRALQGWRDKVDADFSAASALRELNSLESDPVYSQFGLASNGYVLIRLMGRMSISIGRRLGELYDNLPKFVAAARFGLTPSDVAAKIAGLNLDVCIPFGLLSAEDRELAIASTELATGATVPADRRGLGIEIRYNFNPNDSARLRKDVAMAEGLIAENLVPIYLVFSGISPRAEAIARLKRAGWLFLVAHDAADYTKALLGLDLSSLLSNADVQDEVRAETSALMSAIATSDAMRNALRDFPTDRA
ncbi:MULTISPECIES: hypothetical protein [unclassified Microbacterium]|uniref:hypothetical protein n=1 Tax=Microbacterium TaxID=33882 RepID=UPI003BA0C113